jgi:hypothetical protein
VGHHARAAYAANRIGAFKGVNAPVAGAFFKEFVVNFDVRAEASR